MKRRDVLYGAAALVPSLAVGQVPAVEEWSFGRLQSLPVRTSGHPALTDSPWGQAMLFDGKEDALFIDRHPLAGARRFTFEAVFRPDGGPFEQRWFHLETPESPDQLPGTSAIRIMFEIRVKDRGWYLDAFMTGPGYRQALMAPDRLYPLGQWHHVMQSYDGRMYRSFVNGAPQVEVAMPFAPQGPGRCAVGTRLNGVNHFRGAVHMARFTRDPVF